jgi:hypothetical protein
MQIVYMGNNKAQELATMKQPMPFEFHDPMHFNMSIDIFYHHLDTLRTFDVADELATQLVEGEIYDETVFSLKTILTKA